MTWKEMTKRENLKWCFSSHLMSSQFISFHLISCHLISSHVMSSHLMSSHLITSHLISSHLISCHHVLSTIGRLFYLTIIFHLQESLTLENWICVLLWAWKILINMLLFVLLWCDWCLNFDIHTNSNTIMHLYCPFI